MSAPTRVADLTCSRSGPCLQKVRTPSSRATSSTKSSPRLAKTGLSPRELAKAKNRVRSSFVFGLSSTLDRALVLGQFELYFGNAELLKTELDRYLTVTNDDIKRVAAQYFAANNRTVLDVKPSPAAPKTAEGEAK